MKPVTMLNNWVLTKILIYLTTREGVTEQHTEYTAEGARTVFTDAFGFTYEISIRTLGRAHSFGGDRSEARSFLIEKL